MTAAATALAVALACGGCATSNPSPGDRAGSLLTVRLGLTLEGERFVAGEEVTGSVRVLEEGGSRAVKVALLFKERSPVFTDTARTIEGADLGDAKLPVGEERSFSVRLPEDALPGYRSEHGELYWEVEARAGRARESRRIEVVRDPSAASREA